ncbi:hypothetical protein JMJ77_0010749 [Colletotrichum scovillei]|uniref:Uncharacterized protein n=1 Tax=Colletotrichum scovillei TaxID=1209932 RepID=A0A9P7R258_9PEZI|nr:hypothetical protein JMJ77_0010749 [Colletotrichum scovillei]KAG7059715.1 hypothetical protein JMJ78_0015004 [Colletotrichum scovillei]KAG7067162.1 hypothetical protein JMJ76_0008605 [Colletotrichum scovillei]
MEISRLRSNLQVSRWISLCYTISVSSASAVQTPASFRSSHDHSFTLTRLDLLTKTHHRMAQVSHVVYTLPHLSSCRRPCIRCCQILHGYTFIKGASQGRSMPCMFTHTYQYKIPMIPHYFFALLL